METRTDLIYKCISNSRYTPYLLAKKIGAKAILESASFAKGRERYSILMTEEAFKIKQDDDNISFIIDDKEIPFDSTCMNGEKSLDALGREKRIKYDTVFVLGIIVFGNRCLGFGADIGGVCVGFVASPKTVD